MLLSMTGFASTTFPLTMPDGKHVNVTMYLKTLNSRFFETTCKIPHALSHSETEIIKVLKKKLRRGHAFLTIHLSDPNTFKGKVQPSLEAVKDYLGALNTIQTTHNLSGTITITDVLSLPNVFTMEESPLDTQTKATILSHLSSTADALIEGRAREGAEIKNDLEQRFAIMSKEITSIESLSEKMMKAQKEKVAQALDDLDLNDAQARETQRGLMYQMLDKIDIHEEISRFKSHLEHIRSLVSSSGTEKGKQIDFTLQELFRETNTIAAKCSNASISRHAITMKVEIEKAREQTQNIV